MPIVKPLQFSLRFLFALTALSVGQVVLMRLLPQWHLWFLLYVFVVGLCLGIAFSKERGGPGSLFHNLLWTSVAIAVASMDLLRDGAGAELHRGFPVAAAWCAFWGDVIGGVAAWLGGAVNRILEPGLERRPPRHDEQESA